MCVIGLGEMICVSRGRMYRVVFLGEGVSVFADIRMMMIESVEIVVEIVYFKVIVFYDE